MGWFGRFCRLARGCRFGLKLKDDAGGRSWQPLFQGAGGGGAVACGAVLLLRVLLTGAIGVGFIEVSVNVIQG
jgi:hypothetical protein